MYETTLSIDLGASYTKISYRKNCLPTQVGSKDERARVFTLDNSPLIPSLAIQTKSKSQPWIFGRQAAELTPDSTMRVYQNWKANLFRPENGKESASAIIVAEHFFCWLREALESSGVNLKKVHTRVALPAFKEFDEKALVIALCMEMSGWESPLILKATEPHANTIGLFSKGRNIASKGKDGRTVLNYGMMFGQDNVWVLTARGHVLFGDRTNQVTAMVADIGAFTTDLAAVTFDVTAPDEFGDGLQRIEQESHAIGVINELDKPLFEALAIKHGLDWSEVSFFDREQVKRAIYDGGAFSLITKKTGAIELGQVSDRSLIDEYVFKFVEQLWNKVSAFIDKEQPTVIYLTGGGSLIPVVREGIEKHLRKRRRKIGTVDVGDFLHGQAKWREWQWTGEGLHRLATALGGLVWFCRLHLSKFIVEEAQLRDGLLLPTI